MGLGTSPLSGIDERLVSLSMLGTADSNALV